jgi:hypothetical protein
VIGGVGAAGGVRGATLGSEGGRPFVGAEHHGPACAGDAAEEFGQIGGEAAGGVGLGPQLDDRRGEFHQVDGVEQVAVEEHFALGGGQGQYVSEAGEARGGWGGVGHGEAGAAGYRADAAAGRAGGWRWR